MIRGIDNQIAVQRVNDLTRDASAQLKRAELTHEFQSRINRALEEREQQQVVTLQNKENPRIVAQRDEGRQPPDQKKKKKKKDQAAPYDDLLSGAIASDPQKPRVDIEI